MCKVRIVNFSNDYSNINSTSVEADVSDEVFQKINELFMNLNKTRTNSCMPSISISKV